MASKKDKILESAQRFVLKGQLDKAIKDYQQVVAMDPREIRYRQRLAELLVRDNRKEEAIVQYEDIGKHYAENSYFLKAIAIYKQIQRLSPGNNAISLTIASLNHQQGLIGNALAEYGQVVAQLEKEGAQREALKVVEKMLGVDAEQATTRRKYAELLFATGSKDDSRQTFSALLTSLKSSGHHLDAEAVSARMRELFPEQQEDGTAGELPVSGAAPLTLDGFAPSDQVPGVTELSSRWQVEAPTSAPVAQESDAGEAPAAAEPPDAFGEPFLAQETEEASTAAVTEPPSAFGAWESEPPAVSPGADAPQLGSAWEEEIELDLDDDLSVEVSASTEPAPADLAAAPDLVASQTAAAPDTVVSNDAAAPDTDIDLHLDFSLDLDFDEVVGSLEDESLEDAPLDQEPQAVVELDLDETDSLELSLPQESEAFGDIAWSEESEELPEQEEPQEQQELQEHEELAAPLDAAEPEACTDLDAPDEPELSQEDAGGEELLGWNEIYPGTGESDQSELDIDELESHYDLGIGYKEMGMYSGAIKEFDVAARNPQRRVDCLTLQAICYREKGEPEKAEELLRRGLSLDVLSHDERLSVSYELAFLLESTGVLDEAIGLYREVNSANPSFHDVSRRLSSLSGEEHLDIIELEQEEGS